MRFGLRAEGKSLTEVYENTRAQGFGDEVKRRVLIGTYVLSAGFYDAYYIRALKVRRRIADDFDQAWTQCDALLTPSTPTAAFALGDKDADPVTMYLNDVFTVPANLAGLPGISVPTGWTATACRWGCSWSAARWTRRRCSRWRARLKRRRRSGRSRKSGVVTAGDAPRTPLPARERKGPAREARGKVRAFKIVAPPAQESSVAKARKPRPGSGARCAADSSRG
jgi:hypothetical protein